MTDAPERIALRWLPGAAVTDGPLMDHPDYTQYIRADVVAGMIAADREAWLGAMKDEMRVSLGGCDGDVTYDDAIMDAAAAIRNAWADWTRCPVERDLEAFAAECQSARADLVESKPLCCTWCDCGMGGPCMWDQCKHPIHAIRKRGQL